MKSELFVKSECGGVISPDVQCQVVATVFFCKRDGMVIKRVSDSFSTCLFIHTQIVDIERLYIGKYIVIGMLNKNTKNITENLSVRFGYKDRSVIVCYYRVKLLGRVLCRSTLKNIRAGFMMDTEDLTE